MKATITRRRRMPGEDIYKRIMNLVGTDVWDDGDGKPPQARTMYHCNGQEVPRGHREAMIVAANNDGAELWFGYPDRWAWHIGGRDVRLLTRYLVWDWHVKARWLGLRRPIYYWALHRHLAAWRRRMTRERNAA